MSYQNSASCDEENTIGLNGVQVGPETLEKFSSLPRILYNLDEDRIFAEATDYRNWNLGRYTLKDLPPFDNSVFFGITLDDENTNIREEIRKLVQFVESQKPPLFDSYGTLGGTDAAGFENLSNVVDQITCNFHIIRHDNACLALDHYVREQYYEVFKTSRQVIRWRYQGQSRMITGQNPTTLSNEKENMQAYHALIDFIFQSLAWWLAHVERKSWQAPLIALLSRWSVKLKLIALDPSRWAEHSLGRGEDVMRRISIEQKREDKIVIEFPPNGLADEVKKINFPDDKGVDYSYYTRKLGLRENLHKLVSRILDNLLAYNNNSSSSSPNAKSPAFEVRTLIYRAGLDETLRHLTVQRNGTVETSSNPADLGRSYRALQLLLSNVQSIAKTELDVGRLDVAKIHWHMKQGKASDPDTGSVITTRLDDVVSALVPLSLTGISHLVKTLERFLSPGDPEDEDEYEYAPVTLDVSPEDYPRIEFSLSTSRGRSHAIPRVGSKMISPSKSPLLSGGDDADEEVEQFDTRDMASSEVTLRRNAMRVIKEYKSRKAEMKSWTITDDSVRVRTTIFSSTVLTIAFAIIAGCLVIPFTIGDRVSAVDPFQFVTFGWLVAGAFLVGAKGRYVENWPWHDFLRGQIVCRSVSELAVASRVKKQGVLLYLLHHEHRNPLLFRGPYQGVFRRQGRAGFSIDVPTEHATVLAAGFIVLEAFEPEEESIKIKTILQDTREDKPSSADGGAVALIFAPVEVLGNEGKKQQLGYKGTIRLRENRDFAMLPQYKIIGLLTADCNFI